MKFSVVAILVVSFPPTSAFTPSFTRIPFHRTRVNAGSRNTESSAFTDASNSIAEDPSGITVDVGQAAIFAAPIAALAAGRQALEARDQIKEEAQKAEEDLKTLKKDLTNTNNLISGSFATAAVSLGAAVFNFLGSGSQSSSTSSTSPSSITSTEKVIPFDTPVPEQDIPTIEPASPNVGTIVQESVEQAAPMTETETSDQGEPTIVDAISESTPPNEVEPLALESEQIPVQPPAPEPKRSVFDALMQKLDLSPPPAPAEYGDLMKRLEENEKIGQLVPSDEEMSMPGAPSEQSATVDQSEPQDTQTPTEVIPEQVTNQAPGDPVNAPQAEEAAVETLEAVPSEPASESGSSGAVENAGTVSSPSVLLPEGQSEPIRKAPMKFEQSFQPLPPRVESGPAQINEVESGSKNLGPAVQMPQIPLESPETMEAPPITEPESVTPNVEESQPQPATQQAPVTPPASLPPAFVAPRPAPVDYTTYPNRGPPMNLPKFDLPQINFELNGNDLGSVEPEAVIIGGAAAASLGVGATLISTIGRDSPRSSSSSPAVPQQPPAAPPTTPPVPPDIVGSGDLGSLPTLPTTPVAAAPPTRPAPDEDLSSLAPLPLTSADPAPASPPAVSSGSYMDSIGGGAPVAKKSYGVSSGSFKTSPVDASVGTSYLGGLGESAPSEAAPPSYTPSEMNPPPPVEPASSPAESPPTSEGRSYMSSLSGDATPMPKKSYGPSSGSFKTSSSSTGSSYLADVGDSYFPVPQAPAPTSPPPAQATESLPPPSASSYMDALGGGGSSPPKQSYGVSSGSLQAPPNPMTGGSYLGGLGDSAGPESGSQSWSSFMDAAASAPEEDWYTSTNGTPDMNGTPIQATDQDNSGPSAPSGPGLSYMDSLGGGDTGSSTKPKTYFPGYSPQSDDSKW